MDVTKKMKFGLLSVNDDMNGMVSESDLGDMEQEIQQKEKFISQLEKEIEDIESKINEG